jgi:hypothetical protein
MDNVTNLHLSHTRYSRLVGETGTLEATVGGILKITLSNSLEKIDSAAVVHVEIDVLAVPKAAKNLKDYAFKLGITVEGIYEGDHADAASFASEDFRLSLSQPLYTMGVIELRDLAQKLGFSNIQLPWDISVLSEKSKEKKPALPEKAKPKKTPRPVAKKTAEK